MHVQVGELRNISSSFIVSQSFLCSVAKLCPILCDPMDCSLPGSSVQGISQARILESVAISSSRGSSWLRDWTQVSCSSCMEGRFFVTEPPGKPFLHLVNFSDTSSQSLHANIVCKSQRITWQLYRDKWTLLMKKIKRSPSCVGINLSFTCEENLKN